MKHECSPTLSLLESQKSVKRPDLGFFHMDLELEIHGRLELRYAGGGHVLQAGSGLMVTVIFLFFILIFFGEGWCAEEFF